MVNEEWQISFNLLKNPYPNWLDTGSLLPNVVVSLSIWLQSRSSDGIMLMVSTSIASLYWSNVGWRSVEGVHGERNEL